MVESSKELEDTNIFGSLAILPTEIRIIMGAYLPNAACSLSPVAVRWATVIDPVLLGQNILKPTY